MIVQDVAIVEVWMTERKRTIVALRLHEVGDCLHVEPGQNNVILVSFLELYFVVYLVPFLEKLSRRRTFIESMITFSDHPRDAMFVFGDVQ